MCIGFLTPASLHYVRNHGPPPKGSWKDHRISLGGLCPSPIEISMSDLWTLPRHSVAVLLGTITLSIRCMIVLLLIPYSISSFIVGVNVLVVLLHQ